MKWLEIGLIALLATSESVVGSQDEASSACAAPLLRIEASSAAGSALSTLRNDPKRIAQGLKSKDEDKARRAVSELAALGRDGAPYLAEALELDSSLVRLDALLELGKLAGAAEAALPKLVAFAHSLGDCSDATLGQTFFECGFIGVWFNRDMSQVLSQLSDGLDDAAKAAREREHQARLSSGAIARIGAANVPALLELVAPLDRGASPNEFTAPRIGLALALKRAVEDGPTGAFAGLWPQLERSLSAERASERLTALVALSPLPREEKVDSAAIARAVASRLESQDPAERAVAAAVLAYRRAPCELVGGKCEPLLADPVPYVRLFAALALRESCGDSPAAEDVLIASLSADDQTRVAALESMHAPDRVPSERAVGPITKCLESKNERVLVAALEALGSCGERAKASVAKVKALTKHKNGLVSSAADSALKSMR